MSKQSDYENGINIFVKRELKYEVETLLNEHGRKNRKWYLGIGAILIIILGVLLYIGIMFNRWNIIWEAKDKRDKAAMEQYMKDRLDWIELDSTGAKNGTSRKTK